MCKKDLIDQANGFIDEKKGPLKMKGFLDRTKTNLKVKKMKTEQFFKDHWVECTIVGVYIAAVGKVVWDLCSIRKNPDLENFELENEEEEA